MGTNTEELLLELGRISNPIGTHECHCPRPWSEMIDHAAYFALWESDFTVQSQTTIIRTYELIYIGIPPPLRIEGGRVNPKLGIELHPFASESPAHHHIILIIDPVMIIQPPLSSF